MTGFWGGVTSTVFATSGKKTELTWSILKAPFPPGRLSKVCKLKRNSRKERERNANRTRKEERAVDLAWPPTVCLGYENRTDKGGSTNQRSGEYEE